MCDDGVVESYQAVFAWASSFLRRHFVGKFVMEDSGKRKDDITMHLPGVSKEIVTALVRILVKGETTNVTNPVKRELDVLWRSLVIDRVEFDKLDTIPSVEIGSRIKILRSAQKLPKQHTRNSIIIPDDNDDSHETLIQYTAPSKMSNKLKIKKFKEIAQEPQNAIEMVPQPETIDTNKSALIAVDRFEDLPIIIPGYENVVDIDDKSLAGLEIENVPVLVDNSLTSFEIPSDISIFPAIEDRTAEVQNKDVIKRKHDEVDSYIEQRLKASRFDKVPKQAPKQQDTIRSKSNTGIKPTKVVNPEMEPLACYVCNSTRDKEKRALNLKNVFT